MTGRRRRVGGRTQGCHVWGITAWVALVCSWHPLMQTAWAQSTTLATSGSRGITSTAGSSAVALGDTTGTTTPHERFGHTLTYLQSVNALVLVGGTRAAPNGSALGESESRVAMYPNPLASDTLTQLPLWRHLNTSTKSSLPVPALSSHCAIPFSDRILILFGAASIANSNTPTFHNASYPSAWWLTLDTALNTSYFAPLALAATSPSPLPRAHQACAYYPQSRTVYVFGGVTQSGEDQGAVWKLLVDPTDTAAPVSWTTVPVPTVLNATFTPGNVTQSQPRNSSQPQSPLKPANLTVVSQSAMAASAIFINGVILSCFGAASIFDPPTSSCLCLNPTTDLITLAPSLTTPPPPAPTPP
ncbi:hypothetical protein M427DRAFT_201367 [Gonapodya prolifera JEL478]|uniref:Galactose oxidase n=1 Tax=Gonapodya prolifera (strain JEL478) TaxID=1344416 RepID=A0A138ZZN6_GONPJ|nr:hypothetical protein M427DRAFT_201367 [Gonapodya prolifera JEL478]|eukprot:KXS09964.1 hypothetical protein M427DRAFT_201367 [Gonapodya prolifera JEL478]